jgi:long-chain acyl-CoA synthetase
MDDTTVDTAAADSAELQARPWTAHYSPTVPATITVPERSLTWLLDEAAHTSSATIAIEYFGTRISYAQFSALATRFAQALLKAGIQPGDRVSLALPNTPQFPIAFYGALRAGAVVVPTNPLYTASELEHQLRDSGAKAIIILDQFYEHLAEIRANTSVEQVIVADVADYFPRGLALAYHAREAITSALKREKPPRIPSADPSVHRFRQFIGQPSDGRGLEAVALPEPAAPDDLALLQYTGGTTGVAKGAMLSHRNLLSNAFQCLIWNEKPIDTKHITLCVAPFFHVYGLTVEMNLTILAKSTMALLPRFTVKETLDAIEKYKPDLFPGIPTLYLALAREVERRPRDLSSIQVCISGSAPLPLEVQRRFEAVSGAKVVEGYGLTEASPVTHCNPVYGDCRIGTIGLPLPNTDSRILAPDSWEPVSPGERGEIAVRGPQVMMGYWNRPEETAKVLNDGWLRTGDIGEMSEDGYFSIVDRAKDLIIASGLKVFPREVEEVLYQHPKVLEACVVGMPDEYRGETVWAFIVPKPGETLTADELNTYCREHLAPYKAPKHFEFRESLPKTLIGKVLRRTLRDETLAARAARATGAQSPA